mgnify:CR=1 FL=1
MGIMVNEKLRLQRAAARAEAAAERCEKLAELLELKISEDGNTATLDRVDAQDGAICELAEIIAGGDQ